MNKVYIVYDKDLLSTDFLFAVLPTEELAEERRNKLAEQFTEEILKDDPANTGVDRDDYPWLIKETKNSIGIIEKEIEEI